MIYILQKSKTTTRERMLRYQLTEAKIFLYEINFTQLTMSNYFVLGSDNAWEMEDLLNYFSDKYLIKQENTAFERYMVNQEIIKPERLRNNILKVSSIKKIVRKIQNEFTEYEITFGIKDSNIHLVLTNKEIHIKIVIDSGLNILESFIQGDVEKYPLSTLEETQQKINSLLTKQRYYYKKKESNNDDK